MESCPSVKNILLLDSEGKRVAVKYYTDDWPALSAKLAFEKSVFAKTQKANAGTETEIVMFDGHIVVYKFIQDLHFFVTGGDEENELILASVLQGFYDAVDLLLRNIVEKRTALENLDLILLCLDEIVDGGTPPASLAPSRSVVSNPKPSRAAKQHRPPTPPASPMDLRRPDRSRCLELRSPHPDAKLAREAADASARKRKAVDGGEAGAAVDADAAAPVPEEAVMGDAPSAPAPHVGGGEEVNPNPSIGGCCSDSVSVELSMGGDYYHACCGDADLDLHAPEGPKAPYVGDKEPLSTLAAEFQSGSPILQEKIKLLGEQYYALRRTRGDGNCFYRSFMFSYLEHILETQDKAEVERILKKIEQCKKTLQALGYIEFTFEDFFSIFIEQLESALQGQETSIGPEELLERTRDQMISDYVVMFFRFVTSGEIQRRAEFFEPFISGLTNSTVAQFCKAAVEPMGEESDHVHITALSDALGVPIRVMYLDRSSCDPGNISVNHHDFIPAADSSEGDAAMTSTPAGEKPYITLLYRPGHYDILYPK